MEQPMDPLENISALLNVLPQAALIVGRDSKIGLANARAKALFGDTFWGRHYALTLRQPEMLAAIEAALFQGESTTLGLDLRQGDLDNHFNITVAPLPMGVLCVFEDVSAQAQTDLMRRDFVANVSHELRTPLTALQGFIETLQGPARDDAGARTRFLTIMANEADRMNRLVSDLLNLSRVEAQERLRPSTEIDIAATIALAIDSLRPFAVAAQVGLRVSGCDVPCFLCADADQITQVIVNLVENAIKYGSTPQGEVAIALTPHATLRGPAIRISVTDQGAGIADEHLPRLTERFYRVDSHRNREQGGTGLGLAIVKHIVSRHRGRLSIESRAGVGSCFAVVLPLN
jgi:two-component system phosphate regulon sensor histidine kinase PhoR